MNNPVKKDWLRLPDLVLCDIMKMIALESITTLCTCTQVCTSWEEKIMGNPLLMQIARTKIETAFGPGKFPSNAEISNAMWLGKQRFIFIGLSLIIIIDFYFFHRIQRHP